VRDVTNGFILREEVDITKLVQDNTASQTGRERFNTWGYN